MLQGLKRGTQRRTATRNPPTLWETPAAAGADGRGARRCRTEAPRAVGAVRGAGARASAFI